MTFRLVTHNPIWKGIQPKEKRKLGKRTSRNHGQLSQSVEAESNSNRESSLEFSKRTRVYLGTRRPNATQVSTSFHQVYFRDQHQLNSGTEFLFGWETVTTHNFRSFFRTSTFYYSQITIHRSLFIIFQVNLTFRDTFRSFTIHLTLFISERKPLFMCITHVIVNLVYGYSKFT